MLPGLEWRCKEDIRKNIRLPHSSWLVVNDGNVRLCYIVLDQKKARYITLPTRVEAAKFLAQKGIIDDYVIKGESVKFFIKTMCTVVGSKGEPLQSVRMFEIQWSQLKLHITQSDVVRFAVDQEYEEKGKIAGILTDKLIAKVIHLGNNINQAA